MMGRPKILLIQPPIREFYLTRKRTIPYGLASIAANLDRAGFDTVILDSLATAKSKPLAWPEEFSHLHGFYGRSDISLFSLFHDFRHFGYAYEHLGVRARETQPIVVGISSLFTAYADQALDTAAAIRKFWPPAWIVLGGHHPTCFPDQVLDHPDVDFVIRGEGEASFPLLCRALADGMAVPAKPRDAGTARASALAEPGLTALLKTIPGIGFGTGPDRHVNDPAWMNSLARPSLPNLDKIDTKFYRIKKKAAITVVASRGCPMSCAYCSVSSTSSHGPFRQRPVADVLDEIQAQARQKEIGFIDFEDENLTLNKKWAMALFSGLKKIFNSRAVELRAMNGLFPPSLDTEVLAAMKAAGFKTLNLSVGSFSAAQLRRFKRPDVRRAHDRVVQTAGKLGLECVSYIIGSAPDQSAATTLEDLFILAGQRTLAGLSVYYPAPGSLDFNRCRTLGLLPDRFSMMRSTALPLDHVTTRLEAVTLLRLARMLNFLKSHIDTHGDLPLPLPFDPSGAMAWQTGQALDRWTVSRCLAQWFLEDGLIRGVDRKGRVYIHQTDKALTLSFSKASRKMLIMGVKKGPARVRPV